ncbi:Maf family protein [Devosia sp.]|uniref:Maf family protein n=1 Tax=Devosia sp. TaxID=1871048 RepID=UPI003A8E36CB
MPELILASRSAARNALLAATALRFSASPAQIDERALEAEVLGKSGTRQMVAEALAIAKARAGAAAHPGAVVIGADQVLALYGTLLHKPVTSENARRQLDQLAGRTHQLHAGVALVKDGTVLWSAVETATLTMRGFSPAERDAVLAAEGEGIFDCVGAYRLEGPSVHLFERIEGDYFTILGLPLLPLLAALRQHAPEVLGGFT